MRSADGMLKYSKVDILYLQFHDQTRLINSNRINTEDGHIPDLTDVSRGIFGATVGIDRLLKLWDKYNIKTSWYIPTHSLESFLDQMIKIRDAGHEM